MNRNMHMNRNMQDITYWQNANANEERQRKENVDNENTFRMGREKWKKSHHHTNGRCFGGLTIVS